MNTNLLIYFVKPEAGLTAVINESPNYFYDSVN